MAEYIEREAVVRAFCEHCRDYVDKCAYDGTCEVDIIATVPAADVKPLSVVAEHVKKRLYETAFNTSEAVARNAIADMAGRIDFWIDELKDGDAK